MNRIPATRGLLFGSLLYRSDLHSQTKLQQFWSEKYGDSEIFVPQENPLISYYSQEMGEPLSRFFVLTKTLFPRETLLGAKVESLLWEKSWSREGQRQVNVDIGFLSSENFLLATTKPYSHRIYLGQNIYAELTYIFQNKTAEVLPWTYPDYRDNEKKQFFLKGRKIIHSVV